MGLFDYQYTTIDLYSVFLEPNAGTYRRVHTTQHTGLIEFTAPHKRRNSMHQTSLIQTCLKRHDRNKHIISESIDYYMHEKV